MTSPNMHAEHLTIQVKHKQISQRKVKTANKCPISPPLGMKRKKNFESQNFDVVSRPMSCLTQSKRESKLKQTKKETKEMKFTAF